MIQRSITISCDGCGEESSTELTETVARKTATADGWKIGTCRASYDYCPTCRDRPVIHHIFGRREGTDDDGRCYYPCVPWSPQ